MKTHRGDVVKPRVVIFLWLIVVFIIVCSTGVTGENTSSAVLIGCNNDSPSQNKAVMLCPTQHVAAMI